jgi:AmmeMemoRadiSam system protein A
MDAAARTELLQLARTTLESHFRSGHVPDYPPQQPELSRRTGAFVTLLRGDSLRGCIGQIIADRELYRVVQHCAVAAATEDTRFEPVAAEELAELEIEISVLTPFRRVADVAEIEVGRHGLIISRSHRRGLLLPQVAAEYGWDRETFLAQTCRKAGLPHDAWKDPSTRIECFEAEVFSESTVRAGE